LTEENPRLVLNDYKTKKKYGTIQIPIPPALYELIQECRKAEICKNEYVFTNSIGQPYDRNQYSGYALRTLKRIFGRPVTLVALRHSYTSSVIDYNRPIRELKAIATSMGHSVSAQKKYQWTGEKNEVVVDTDQASV
jgi:integrase